MARTASAVCPARAMAMIDHGEKAMKASKKKWTRPASPRPVLTRGEMAAEALKVIPGGIAALASMLAMIWIWLAL